MSTRKTYRLVVAGALVIALVAPAAGADILLDLSYTFSAIHSAQIDVIQTWTGQNATELRSQADTNGNQNISQSERDAFTDAVRNQLEDPDSASTSLNGHSPSQIRVDSITWTGLLGSVNQSADVDMDVQAKITYPRPDGSTYTWTRLTEDRDQITLSVEIPEAWNIKEATGFENVDSRTDRSVTGTATAELDIHLTVAEITDEETASEDESSSDGNNGQSPSTPGFDAIVVIIGAVIAAVAAVPDRRQ